MKTNSHIKSQSEAQSLRFNQIKKVAKVVVVILGAIVGLMIWAVVKPIFRGVGWLISILTMLAIIYWLMTL